MNYFLAARARYAISIQTSKHKNIVKEKRTVVLALTKTCAKATSPTADFSMAAVLAGAMQE